MSERDDIQNLVQRHDDLIAVIKRLAFNGGQITVADLTILESARRDVLEVRTRHHFATEGTSPHDFAS